MRFALRVLSVPFVIAALVWAMPDASACNDGVPMPQCSTTTRPATTTSSSTTTAPVVLLPFDGLPTTTILVVKPEAPLVSLPSVVQTDEARAAVPSPVAPRFAG